MKRLVILSAVATVGAGIYGTSQIFSGERSSKEAARVSVSDQENSELASDRKSRAPASRSGLLSEGAPAVKTAVKETNASRGRSPAVERPAETDAQLVSKYRSWMKDHGFSEKAETAKNYFAGHPDGEILAMAMALSGQPELNEQMQEVHHWANLKIFENPVQSAETIGNALPKIVREANSDREWAVSMLYGIGQKSEVARRDVRTTLLREVNRQGIQTLDGMTTLVKVLRIEKNQQWVNEVRKEFEELNPGSDLTEYVALRTE